MNSQVGTSAIRTITPMIAGLLITWAIRQGIPVDESFRQPLTEILTAAISGLYYLIVRVLETRVSPAFGWLLGSPKQPAYSAPPPPKVTRMLHLPLQANESGL